MSENFANLLSGINLPNFSMPAFGLNSILDIAVIAFILYKVMMWIKESRTWALFKGIIVAGLAYLLAFLFGLDAVLWIINSTLSVAMIAAVVVFQPEIRKFLERLGTSRNLPLLSQLDQNSDTLTEYTINEITEALTKMAEVKTGALIVIEQQVRLNDIAEKAVLIDALLTSQLLINIFENKTPLHDGAVLVRENRVKAATCILPLTQDKMSSELGTRHRAAVGISEISDVFAFVVSEESGIISVARNGKLRRGLDKERIHDILSECLAKSPKSAKSAKKLINFRRRGE